MGALPKCWDQNRAGGVVSPDQQAPCRSHGLRSQHRGTTCPYGSYNTGGNTEGLVSSLICWSSGADFRYMVSG